MRTSTLTTTGFTVLAIAIALADTAAAEQPAGYAGFDDVHQARDPRPVPPPCPLPV